MDLIIYNRDLERVDRLSEKFSMVRNLKYNKVDSFQITTNLTKRNLQTLQKHRVIKLQNSDELAYITHLERLAEDTKRLTVKGYGLEHYLFRRTVNDYYYAEDTVINHIINILNDNVFNPKNSKRKIPNLNLVIDSTVGATEKVPYQVDEDTDVLSVLNELCAISDLGYKVIYNNSEEVAELTIYKGINKTSDNPYERPVIFSPDRENVLEQRLIEDDSEYKNVLLVIGQGEEDDKFKTIVGEEEKSGLDRFEGCINAQDLDPDNDGEWLSPEEYSELLKTRGKVKIKDFKPLLTYESKIHTGSNVTYREDFNLGDIVEFQNKEWEIKETPRIVEVEEVYEDTFELRVTFGEMLPTPAEKLSQVENEAKKDKGGKVVKGDGEVDLAQVKRDIKQLEINKASKQELLEAIESVEKGKDGIGLNYSWNGTKLGIKREDELYYNYIDLKGIKGDRGADGLNGRDGIDGRDGVDGIGLDYSWNGTKLGVKKENESSYAYVDLKGVKGDKGDKGQDAVITKESIKEALEYTPADEDKVVSSINGQIGDVIMSGGGIHTLEEIEESMAPQDFEVGVTVGNVRLKSWFPSIQEWGVVITFINNDIGFGQIFITVDGDMWSRRSNSRTSWRKWYSNKHEIQDKTSSAEYKIVADDSEFYFEKV